MRSIRYILGGRPHCLDDCLDLARRQRPVGVRLQLGASQLLTDLYVWLELVGEYSWEFAGGCCRCRESYGALVSNDPDRSQDRRIRGANKELVRRLAELEALGLDVVGKDSRFDRSVLAWRELGSAAPGSEDAPAPQAQSARTAPFNDGPGPAR